MFEKKLNNIQSFIQSSHSNSLSLSLSLSLIRNQNQIKIYIAPYVHEDSEALGGWITCSRRVGIDEFLNVF